MAMRNLKLVGRWLTGTATAILEEKNAWVKSQISSRRSVMVNGPTATSSHPWASPSKFPTQIRLAKFEIEAEFVGNLPPQFNADPGPATVGIVNIEGRPGSYADNYLLLRY